MAIFNLLFLINEASLYEFKYMSFMLCILVNRPGRRALLLLQLACGVRGIKHSAAQFFRFLSYSHCLLHLR